MTFIRPTLLLSPLLLAALVLWSLSPFAQTLQSPGAEPSLEILDSRITETEASGELNETEKTALLENYRKTQSLLEQSRIYQNSTEEYVQARESAPENTRQLRERLQLLEAAVSPELDENTERLPLADVEQELLRQKTTLTGLEARLADIQSVLESQNQRQEQARQRLTEAKRQQSEVAEAIELDPPEGESARLSEARRWSLEAQVKSLSAEIEMLNQELLSRPMRIELLGAQLDLASLEAGRERQVTELLENLVLERRRGEAQSARERAEESEREAFGKHPLVQELAESNTELGDELNQLAADQEAVTQEENLISSGAKRIADNFRLTRQKLDIAGLSEALGQVLLEQRRVLPEAADFRLSDNIRQERVVDSSLRQLRNQEERARLRDINLYVEELLAPVSESWQGWLRDELLALADNRRELIDQAIAADESYLQALGELEFAQRELSETVIAYSAFLDERLLWIRSGEPPSWDTLGQIGSTLDIFFTLEHGQALLKAIFWPDSFPWLLLLGVALFVLLIRQSDRLGESLQRSSRNVGQLRHDRLSSTAKAIGLTVIMALPWPILFTALGLHLQNVRDIQALVIEQQLYQSNSWTGQFVPAIGTAFSAIALYTFFFLVFRIFCTPGGLAISHFRWDPDISEQLRQETRRLMWVFLPAAFVLVIAVSYDPAQLAGGLSRLSFLVVMSALAWYFSRILDPVKGTLRDYYASHPGSPWTWFRYIWLALGVSLPLLLGLLATIGYVYTATQFGSRLVDTLWLIAALILFHQFVVRWTLVTERRLAFNDALERHRAQRAAQAQQEIDGDEITTPIFEEPEIDYSALSEDTHKLNSTALTVVGALGLWAIWVEVLPAFGILDEISLWSYSATEAGVESIIPVTLSDLILVAIILVVGLIAVRRFPALMEILILSRLNISAGSRYAIATLTQYSIVAIGVVLVFGLLGGSWSEIQWLIAALGVGIGFGLQEIVANFICGLILLFERPIRIGDVVTVGDTSGVVTKIRIRSTTIRNWDQQELVVPNKEFITGRLLNWTLSDPVTRIVIPVGIAYGSDVTRALKLVHEAAEQHERVLDEPAPLVTFDSFGDNALVITLRCYIGSMDYRLLTISELHQSINDRFNEAGIVVAFPQQDVHLDTSQPLEIRLQPAQDPG